LDYASTNAVAGGIMFLECLCVRVWTLSANISGTDGDIDKRYTALSTAVCPALNRKNWWTLVHKQRQLFG